MPPQVLLQAQREKPDDGLERCQPQGQGQFVGDLHVQGIDQHQHALFAEVMLGQIPQVALELLAIGQAADRVATPQALALLDLLHDHRRHVPQLLAFDDAQLLLDLVDDAQAADGITGGGQQRRPGVKADALVPGHQRVVAKARIERRVAHLQHLAALHREDTE